MQFTVIPHTVRSKSSQNLTGQNEAYLIQNNWDDYGFKTSFFLIFFKEDGTRLDIGEVKIMSAGMKSGYTVVRIRTTMKRYSN